VTGAEHYEAAQRLLETQPDHDDPEVWSSRIRAENIAAAAVHAQLAAVALAAEERLPMEDFSAIASWQVDWRRAFHGSR